MWLASASYRVPVYGIVNTADWTTRMWNRARMELDNTLFRAGDPKRQRLFRMNITLCLHRVLSATEKRKLPGTFFCAVGGLAGGPVELLETIGGEPRPAALPCVNPGHELIERGRPDLWIPFDCGECEPCQARLAIRLNK